MQSFKKTFTWDLVTTLPERWSRDLGKNGSLVTNTGTNRGDGNLLVAEILSQQSHHKEELNYLLPLSSEYCSLANQSLVEHVLVISHDVDTFRETWSPVSHKA